MLNPKLKIFSTKEKLMVYYKCKLIYSKTYKITVNKS